MLDIFNSKQKKIIIVVAIVIAFGVMYCIYFNAEKNQTDFEENILVENSKTTQEINQTEEELIVIHITGSVKAPGIVKLKEGSRIEDAIQAAGGLTEDADISKVNLAYILEDGTKLKIPSSVDIEGLENEDILSKDSGESILEDNEENKTNKTSSTININRATQIDLESLPGIGPSLASKIISYRDQNGKFLKQEDIKNVSGIGDSKYEKIKDYIYVK